MHRLPNIRSLSGLTAVLLVEAVVTVRVVVTDPGERDTAHRVRTTSHVLTATRLYGRNGGELDGHYMATRLYGRNGGELDGHYMATGLYGRNGERVRRALHDN